MRWTRRRWWITGLVAAWVLALLVAAAWSAHRDPATVREQSDLASGRRTLDQAVARIVAVAGPQVAAEVQPGLTSDCQITLSRRGSELEQTVVFIVPAGEESGLLDRLAGGLPGEWGARYHSGTDRLRADAGDFVAIRGEVAEPGRVRLTADTGCRPD